MTPKPTTLQGFLPGSHPLPKLTHLPGADWAGGEPTTPPKFEYIPKPQPKPSLIGTPKPTKKTGRANALTRGKGRKLGLRKLRVPKAPKS
jgi:hypothetical protein